MQNTYTQVQAKVDYDFSDENIHRVAANNWEMGIKDNDALGLKNSYKHRASVNFLSKPEDLDAYQKGILTNELRSSIIKNKENAKEHLKKTVISGLFTTLGYAGLAAAAVIGKLSFSGMIDNPEFQTTAMAGFLGMASAFSLNGSFLKYDTNNFNYRFTKDHYSGWRNDVETKKQNDRLIFFINGNSITNCVDKEETLKWAEQFKRKPEENKM